MKPAEEYLFVWLDKKYGGAKDIGDWTPEDVIKFAEEYASQKQPEEKKENKHIKIIETSGVGKIKIFDVINKSKNYSIGYVAWYPGWKKYCFFPHEEMMFGSPCLELICNFLVEINSHSNKVEQSEKKDCPNNEIYIDICQWKGSACSLYDRFQKEQPEAEKMVNELSELVNNPTEDEKENLELYIKNDKMREALRKIDRMCIGYKKTKTTTVYKPVEYINAIKGIATKALK